jgi:opacity protein-like surface antigen
MQPMKLIAATALAGIVMAASPTHAADLFGTAPPMMDTATTTPVEVGSNWYLRGDVGYGSENSPTIVPQAGLIPTAIPTTATDLYNGNVVNVNAYNQPTGNTSSPVPVTRGNNQNSNDMTFDVGVGYRVNNYLRFEAEYSFWRGASLGYNQQSRCAEVASPVANTVVNSTGGTTSAPVGYLWAPASCTGYLNATQYNNLAIANAYVDLGNFWGFTPFIGGGLGMNANTITGSTKFYNNNDGSPVLGNTSATSAGTPLQWVTQTSNYAGYAQYAALKQQPNVSFGTQNYNRSISSTHYSVAGALMAGVGFDITPSATLDLTYRYISADLFGSTKNTAQQVMLGVRYMAN